MKRTVLKALLIVFSLCSAAAACPMCRDSTAAGSDSTGSPPAALFNASVLCMLCAFLMVVAFLAVKIVQSIRVIAAS